MKIAIDRAWRYQGLTYPNPAVGALIIKDGRILALGAHERAGKMHAELACARDAYVRMGGDRAVLESDDPSFVYEFLLKNAGSMFKGAQIFVTLEPCTHYGRTPPCSLLIEGLGFSRVVIAHEDFNEQAGGGAKALGKKCEVVVGVCREEAAKLLYPFKAWSENRFVLFKLAQTLNGKIAPGTISSLKSREFVHRLRDRADLLIIGGDTVRADRPVLDARLCGGRAPDVMIVSSRDDFDREIPLFSVPDREVFVSNEISIPKRYRYVLIEGGEGMLKKSASIVDWYLFFVSSRTGKSRGYDFDSCGEFLHCSKIGDDIAIWRENG